MSPDLAQGRRVLACAIFMAVAASALDAQWIKLPTPGLPRLPDGKPNLTAPAPRTADGKPDFSGLWKNDIEWHRRRNMKKGHDPGAAHEITIVDPQRESASGHGAREAFRIVRSENDGHVDVCTQPRNAIGSNGLRAEHVPAAPGLEHRRQGLQQFNGRGLNWHDAEVRRRGYGTGDRPVAASSRARLDSRAGLRGEVRRRFEKIPWVPAG
jgi:hypothetical protein